MQLHHCPDCGLTQLGYIVSPKVVYKNFPFVSGTTRTATEHLQSAAARQLVRDGSARGATRFAVDIGSNDGTLLKAFVPSRRAVPRHRPFGRSRAHRERAGHPHAARLLQRGDGARRSATSTAQPTRSRPRGVFGHIADLAAVMRGRRRAARARGRLRSRTTSTGSTWWSGCTTTTCSTSTCATTR